MRGGNRCSPILRGRRKGEPPPALPRLREFAEGSSPHAHLERPCRVRKGEGRGKVVDSCIAPPAVDGRKGSDSHRRRLHCRLLRRFSVGAPPASSE